MQLHAASRDSLLLSENPKWLQTELMDGTNVPVGTDVVFEAVIAEHDIRLDSHKESTGWLARATRLLSEFREFRSTALPVGAVVLEKRFPGFGDNALPAYLADESKLVAGGGGLHVDPSPLFDRSTSKPVAGLFPFLDAKGRPILLADGHALGYRLGLSRVFSFVEQPRRAHDDRKLLTARLFELCTEAGAILRQLPSDCLRAMWHRWGQVRSLPRDNEYCWLDSVFEFEWTSCSTRKTVTRNVWRSAGFSSLVLKDCGLFPRAPFGVISDDHIAHQFPTEGGYPFQWGSELEDVVSSSINLLEWIVAEGCRDGQSGRTQSPREQQHKTKTCDARGCTMRDQVFISYSHKDKKFQLDLLDHLKPYFRSGAVSVWSDEQIKPGSKWYDEIREALRKTCVAVMLVTKNFLASDFIHEKELGPLLKEAETGGITILWVQIRACAYEETPLKHYQAVVSPPAKPLAEMKAERDTAWVTICEAIKEAASRP